MTSIDLDALKREGQPSEPFTFTLGGRAWACIDPEDLDWKVLLDIDENDPRDVLSAVLGDDYAEFVTFEVPYWKLTKLMDAVNNHYRADTESGESPAS